MTNPQEIAESPTLAAKIPTNLHFYRLVDQAVDAVFARNPEATQEDVAEVLRTLLP